MRALRMCAAVVAASAVGFVAAGSANAALLPPQLDDALKKVNIPGIATANAAAGAGANAAAVDLPGLATLNKSQSGPLDSAKVTRLSLLGQNLIVKEAGTNSGSLAAVGDLVDDLNAELCPTGDPNVVGHQCIRVLSASAYTDPGRGFAATDVLTIVSNDGTEYVAVLPNGAETNAYFECHKANNAIALLDNKVTGPIQVGVKAAQDGAFC